MTGPPYHLQPKSLPRISVHIEIIRLSTAISPHTRYRGSSANIRTKPPWQRHCLATRRLRNETSKARSKASTSFCCQTNKQERERRKARGGNLQRRETGRRSGGDSWGRKRAGEAGFRQRRRRRRTSGDGCQENFHENGAKRTGKSRNQPLLIGSYRSLFDYVDLWFWLGGDDVHCTHNPWHLEIRAGPVSPIPNTAQSTCQAIQPGPI